MSEEQDTTATADATAEQEADTTQATQDAAGSDESKTDESKQEQSQDKGADYDLTIPDGFEMNDEGVASFKEFAKELDLNPEQTQKMLDRHLTGVSSALGNTTEQVDALHNEWAKESMNDKEFGGSGLEENIVAAKKAMNSFSSPAVDKDGKAIVHTDGNMKGQQMTKVEVLLSQTGMGKHPEMIRVFHRVAQAVSQDHFVKGDMKPVEAKKPPEKVMYPGMA
jgi:hypothetical protein